MPTPRGRRALRRRRRAKSLKIVEQFQEIRNLSSVPKRLFNNNLLNSSTNSLPGIIPPIIKRIIINEYADGTRKVPSDNVFMCKNTNKSRVMYNIQAILKAAADIYAISPTSAFCSWHIFTWRKEDVGKKNLLNVQITVNNLSDQQQNCLCLESCASVARNPELDENVNSGLQNLNLAAETSCTNKNLSFETGPDCQGFKALAVHGKNNNKVNDVTKNISVSDTVIEVPDSSGTDAQSAATIVVQTSENDEVIVIDDDVQPKDNDSDVVFVCSKRKSMSTPLCRMKRRKVDGPVIVIDDDITAKQNYKRKGQKRKRGRSNMQNWNLGALSPIAWPNKRVTRSATKRSKAFFTASTPYRKPLIVTEPAYTSQMMHSCATKPNLVTIPEEMNQKRFGDAATDGGTCNVGCNQMGNVEPGVSDIVDLLEENSDCSDDSGNFGSNFLNAGPVRKEGLRPIFIDGSNVAMGHSNGKYFSVRGLKICIDYFLKKGHEVTAVLPMFRKKCTQNSDPALLRQLEDQGHVVFTPARTINGKHIVPYDDRYIVLMAAVNKGIVVSSDNFRDLLLENPRLRETIESRVLNPTWMRDMIIFPIDPLGRNGPTLKRFLQFP